MKALGRAAPPMDHTVPVCGATPASEKEGGRMIVSWTWTENLVGNREETVFFDGRDPSCDGREESRDCRREAAEASRDPDPATEPGRGGELSPGAPAGGSAACPTGSSMVTWCCIVVGGQRACRRTTNFFDSWRERTGVVGLCPPDFSEELHSRLKPH